MDEQDTPPKGKKTKPNEEKKPKRNKSNIEKSIQADKKDGEVSTLRYNIIINDLKTALSKCQMKKQVMNEVTTCAESQGVYRKLTGCLATYTTLQTTTRGEPCFELDKTFYDQCWSAWDNKWLFNKKKANEAKEDKEDKKELKEKRNAISPYLDSMIEDTSFDIAVLPAPVAFEMRSPTTRDMATSALNHIEINLEARIVDYTRWKLSNLDSANNVKSKLIRILAKKVATQAMKGRIQLEVEFDMMETGLNHGEVNAVLSEVGSVFAPIVPNSSRKSISKSYRDNAHLLLPFLCYISLEFERVMNDRRELAESHPELASMSRYERRRLLYPKWQQNKLLVPGKPFAILPDWQLQAVFVDYASTQLETMFGKKTGSLQFFEEHVFDLHRIKHLRKPDWHFMGFRTNGVELHIRLGSLKCRHPPSPNSLNLVDAGYKIPIPKKPVDVTTAERGVYRITETRYDFGLVQEDSDARKIKAVLVDPGVINVIDVRETYLIDCTSVQTIQDQSTVWSITEETYKKEINWGLSRKHEIMRRSGKRMYSSVLESLYRTKKRTCSLEKYVEYLRVYMINLRPLSRELLSRSRRVTRYLIRKNTRRFLDKVADRLMRKPADAPEDEIRVVFYGDGHFKPKKGHVSVPTKAILRRCSHRGLVAATSERGTSKYCPNCTEGEMKDSHGAYRLRYCSSNPNVEHPCIFTSTKIDRDRCATISLALCAGQALRNHSRPIQFCV